MVISPVHFPAYRLWPRKKRGNAFFDNAFYFERGSWALAYAIMAIAKKRGKNSARVWLPDYFCKEPIEILAQFPIEIEYYPVGKDFSLDWDSLEQKAKPWAAQGLALKPDVLVLVHYFGFSNDLEGAKVFCKKYGIELIEDCAHVMRSYQEVGRTGACAVFSPWKFFPIPLLGVLQVREDLREFVPVLAPRHGMLFGIRWYVKREVQRILCAMGVNWYKNLSHVEGVRGSESVSPAPYTSFLRLFSWVQGYADYISARRRENYFILAKFFQEKHPEMLCVKELSNGAVPYLFTFLVKDAAQKYVRALVARGIPAVQWPSLPDAVRANPEQFPWAHFYAQHLILLPVHHNVSARQLEYMKLQIEAVFE